MYNVVDRPLRGRATEAFQPKVQTAPRRHSVKDSKASGNTEDLRDILDGKAKIARSIYGTRAGAPTRDDDHRVGYTKSKSGRAEYNRQDSYELCWDIARHRGATHPLCFTDEVMDHEFPEGFKPINMMVQQILLYGLRISSTSTWFAVTIYMPSSTSH